jgi:Phage integrase, N-terminal SAM-like domain
LVTVEGTPRSHARGSSTGFDHSSRTIETYREALDGFAAHLQATSKRPLDQARREDIEAWMSVLLARWKPATAHNRYRGLHAFYRWLEEEEDIPSPMARMRPPAVPEQPIPTGSSSPRWTRSSQRFGNIPGPRCHRPAAT